MLTEYKSNKLNDNLGNMLYMPRKYAFVLCLPILIGLSTVWIIGEYSLRELERRTKGFVWSSAKEESGTVV